MVKLTHLQIIPVTQMISNLLNKIMMTFNQFHQLAWMEKVVLNREKAPEETQRLQMKKDLRAWIMSFQNHTLSKGLLAYQILTHQKRFQIQKLIPLFSNNSSIKPKSQAMSFQQKLPQLRNHHYCKSQSRVTYGNC